ncbi:WD40/YVTN/BNR-like repeat-containing protein [Flavobacterium sp.]|uniref:WD40/YVTN/BNR-like repeat-containing protein n=1 Tax=Flavobacterium sp. TaxID=239 RepID=UPI002FDB1AC8
MRFSYFVLFALLLICCEKTPKEVLIAERLPILDVTIDTLIADSMSVRAIDISKNIIWYATNNGNYGYYDLENDKHFKDSIQHQKTSPHFRGIAQNSSNIFLLSTEKPAVIYKIDKKNNTPQIVFEDKQATAFYNAIQFWDEMSGIAVGDPQGNKLAILITRDGGRTWQKMNQLLPPLFADEYGFAASNTGLVVHGKQAWITTGGSHARVFHSADKGKTWKVYETPIVSGSKMSGIFTADFYDDTIGIIAGGDYENQAANNQNKAITIDGGKSWSLIGEGEGPGYTSCVQFVPNSGGKQLVAVSTQGLYFSEDSGIKWKKISSNSNYHTLRFLNKQVAIAAGKNRIDKLTFNR